MGVGNLGQVDLSHAGKNIQQKPCNIRNPNTEAKAPKFKELSTQLSEALGESINITVANVPGNKTAIGRHAAGCDEECNVTIAPNIAAKAMKDPAKLEELQTAIQGYLDQCAEIGQEGDQIERSGLVFLANGDIKTWAIAASAVEGAEVEDESISTVSSDIQSKFDYVFEKTTAIKHFSRYSEIIQLLLARTTESFNILDEDASVAPVDEVLAEADIVPDSGVEAEMAVDNSGVGNANQGDEISIDFSAREDAVNAAERVEAVLA